MNNVETIKVVPARYPLRAVGAVAALFVLAVVIQSVAFNPRWEWAVFARWFFDPVILEGLGQTLLLTLIGTALSVVIGGMLKDRGMISFAKYYNDQDAEALRAYVADRARVLKEQEGAVRK